MFAVLCLNKTIDVDAWHFQGTVPLSYAPGMMGALPVFATREDAEAFAEGRYRIAEIIVGGADA